MMLKVMRLHLPASSNGNSLVSINEDILIVQPNENYFGDIVIIVNSSDGSATDAETFILSVIPVNDPPSVSIINDIYIDEDSSTSFRVVANDVDSDSLIYSATGQNLAFDISDELITIIPNQNLSGIVEVSVLVSDGNLASTTNFNLNINEINDSPQIIQEIDNLTLYQNSDDFLIDLTQHFYDVENGHNLEYSIFENHQAVLATISDSNLRLSLEQNIIGSGFISVTASDNLSRDVASINFEVNVLPVNQAPIVNDMILNVDEDEEIVFELDASDESSELQVSLLNEPSNGSISSINGLEVTYIPNENYYGLEEIQFSISDGELYSELSVEIEILSINDSPSFITSTLADATELSEYIQYIEFNDIDGENDAVMLTVAMGPQWLETDGNNIVGTPSGNDSGDYEIILILDDGQDITTATYDLTVINLNELPVASDLNLSLQEDSSISFTLFAFDGDGDFLTYSLTDAQNGTISVHHLIWSILLIVIIMVLIILLIQLLMVLVLQIMLLLA